MQIIFTPYPKEFHLDCFFQKMFSPEFCHVCIGFKEEDLVLDFSSDGFNYYKYSFYVEPGFDIIVDLGESYSTPEESLMFFEDKKVSRIGFILWLFNLRPKNQYWCTDFVSMCLDELGILSFSPKRHPKDLLDLLTDNVI
jgi:hypothetical protein